MKLLKNVRLKPMLLSLSGIWAAGLILFGIYAVHSMRGIEKEFDNILNKNMPITASVQDINRQLLVQSGLVLSHRPDAKVAFAASSKQVQDHVQDLKKRLQSSSGIQTESKSGLHGLERLVGKLGSDYSSYHGEILSLLDSNVAKDVPQGKLQGFNASLSHLLETTREINSQVKKLNDAVAASASDTLKRQERNLLIIAAVIFSAGLFFSFLVFSGITAKLNDTRNAVHAIATGEADLTKRVAVEGKTEVDEIATLLNQFIDRMQTIIRDVKEYGLQVTDGARLIGELSSSLASTAVEGNAQSEEVAKCANDTGEQMASIAAAMEEMTATVSEIAQNTAITSQKSSEAVEKTVEAQELVDRLANATTSINEMSSLIGSIAEQTNLLALNATIEAARAGEAGKGFAVVAGEVKELAKQTGEAVQKIETTIEELKEHVSGVKAVTGEIVSSITEVNELANNVAAAVEEQTATTNEISENAQAVSNNTSLLVTQSEGIKEASTQTAAGSEQARVSAGELSLTAENLANTLRSFKV